MIGSNAVVIFIWNLANFVDAYTEAYTIFVDIVFNKRLLVIFEVLIIKKDNIWDSLLSKIFNNACSLRDRLSDLLSILWLLHLS